MAVDNFVSQPYIRSNISSIIESANIKEPIEKNIKESASNTPNLDNKDTLKTTNIKEPAIKTDDLQINIKDNNGLSVMGKDDLEIEITGNVEIDKDFILNKVSKLDIKDIKLKTPVFDKERKQYVISGKAMDVILGIDVPFEIRLGQRDNKLAIRVDNWAKRGIIYYELKKALSKEGIESYKEKKHLIIETKYTGTVNIPVSKEKKQTAKIESFETNSKNTKFNIDQNGKMTVSFDKVPVKASSDPSKITQKLEKSDAASVKFDFSTEENLLSHNITIEDLDITADLKSQESQLKDLLGEKVEKQIKNNFGDLSTLEITNTTAHISTKGKEKDISAKTNVEVKSTNPESYIKTDINIDFKENKIDISGENLNLKVKDQELTAQKVTYDNENKNFTVNAEGVDAKVNYQGVEANIQGDISVKTSGENIDAEVNGNIKAKGSTKDINGDLETSGEHIIKITKESIDVNIDNVKGSASVNIAKSEAKETKNTRSINVDIKNTDIDASVNLNDIAIDAKVSEGGIKAKINNETNITTDAKINLKAESTQIKGNGEIKGASLNISQEGNTKVNLNESKISGEFNKKKSNGDLSIKGNIEGKVEADISNSGKINIKQEGEFNAQFQKGKSSDKKHFDIKGKGKSANFELDKNKKGDDKITIDLANVEKSTADLKLNTTKVSTSTKGENVKVIIDGDNLDINTKNANSTFDINVKNKVKTKGTTDEVSVKLTAGAKHEGDDIVISAKNTNAEASVKNKTNRLNVEAHTKADVKVHINKESDINIKTDKAISTDAKLTLNGPNGEKKIETQAKAKDFDIGIKDADGDIAINVKDANFTGDITPNKNININTKSKNASDLKINIDETPNSTIIDIGTKSHISGKVNVKDKVGVNFENKEGFKVKVTEEEFSNVEADLKNVKISGGIKNPDTNAELNGQGDIKFKLNGRPKGEDDIINVNYKGNLGGDVNKKNTGEGNFNISGNTSVDIRGENINIENEGQINAKTLNTKFGANAEVNIKGTKSNPVKVNIDDRSDKTKIGFNAKEGGYVKLNNISDLNLGNDKNQVTDIIKTVQLKSTTINYKNMSVEDNGNKMSVNVNSKDMKTFYGNIETEMKVVRDDKAIEIESGNISITPNMNLYSAIKSKLAEKGIKLQGTPTLNDGVLSFKGEVRSDKGKLLSADLSMKCSVKGNQLILDLDDTKAVKVIKDKNIIWSANKALNYTDIEHKRISKTSISLNLDDIFRDLKTTKGINFDKVTIEDNKINIGFHLSSEDQHITKLSSNKDLKGINDYFKNTDISNLSSESILTAYNTIVESGNIKDSAKFMTDIAIKISQNPSNAELNKAMLLISKNKNGFKDGIMDNIVLDFTKQIKLGTVQGNNIIKSLPTEVVKNLADIMDKTISQGGSISRITIEERRNANEMRRLKSIPENRKII